MLAVAGERRPARRRCADAADRLRCPGMQAAERLHAMAAAGAAADDDRCGRRHASALPAGAAAPAADRRFAADAWRSDPRFDGVATRLPRPVRAAAQDARRRAARRAQQGPVGLRAAPGDRCAEPGQLPGHQPRGDADGAGDGGASLVEGMRLFMQDLAKGRVSMTDEQRLRGRPQHRHHARAAWSSRTS